MHDNAVSVDDFLHQAKRLPTQHRIIDFLEQSTDAVLAQVVAAGSLAIATGEQIVAELIDDLLEAAGIDPHPEATRAVLEHVKFARIDGAVREKRQRNHPGQGLRAVRWIVPHGDLLSAPLSNAHLQSRREHDHYHATGQ